MKRQITSKSLEAREKLSLANKARWQDPEYRAKHLARLQADLKKSGNYSQKRRRKTHSPETVEKIRQGLVKRWQDPDFRGRQLDNLRAIAPKGGEASAAVRRIRPPKGTPELRQYLKVAAILGLKVARSMQW
jgi:hypothetical protein